MLNSLNITGLPEIKARALSASSLAYVGDAAYDFFIRTQLVLTFGDWGGNKVNQIKVKCVKAAQQARIAKHMLPNLTEIEEGVLKRGRNYKSASTAKNATIADYRYATGFETLIGYLVLSEQGDRLKELLTQAYALCEEDGLLTIGKTL